jgi:PAS domain S-box-containing protein
VMTGYGDEQVAVDMMKLGAKDYIIKAGSFIDLLLPAVERTRKEIEAETSLKDARQRIQQQEDYYRALLHNMHEDILVIDSDYNVVDVNNMMVRTIGATRDEVIGKKCHQVQQGFEGSCDENGEECHIRDVLETGKPKTYRQHLTQKDGSPIWVEILLSPLCIDGGKPTHVIEAARDITVQVKAEEALIAAERLNRATLNSLDANIAVLNDKGEIIAVNEPWRRFAEANGRHPQYVSEGINYLDVCDAAEGRDADIGHEFADGIRRVIAGELPVFSLEYPCHSPKVERWFRGKVTRFPEDGPVHVVVTHENITERVLAGRTIEESERKHRLLAENTLDVIWMMNMDLEFTYVNPAIETVAGYTQNEWVGTKLREHVDEQHYKRVVDLLQQRVEEPREDSDGVTLELSVQHKNGREIPLEINARLLYDNNGQPIGVQGTGRDITERKQSEQALRESEEKFRNIIEQSNDAIYLLFEDRFELVNKRFLDMFDLSAEDVLRNEVNYLELVAPKSYTLVEDRRQKSMDGEEVPSRYEFVAQSRDGREFEVETSISLVNYKDSRATLGIMRDISERKRLEEQLFQSQKMEGIGRLAGGVAHDFNNLLTIISGHTDLMRTYLDSQDPLLEDLQEILKASQRASDLTRQLLAFSRKQTLQVKVVDLNQIISNSTKMLKRIIGEDIELQTDLDDDLWFVEADPGQMSQIIINLATNARDAMLYGGRLHIETRNQVLETERVVSSQPMPPGSYATIRVCDTGSGMDADTVKKIFEPFFTTKAEGKGTGLGLSTVYGIARQSGGAIDVESEPGEGTCFTIYLPKATRDRNEEEAKLEKDAFAKGHETLLLVEDDAAVRGLATRILKKQGYTVHDASSGGDAYLIAKSLDKPVDLVITDVIMPRMNGAQLIEELKSLWPDIRFLFISGYTAEAISHLGIINRDFPYLQKPFRNVELLAKVRSILDGGDT